MSKQPREVFRIIIYEDGSAVMKTEASEVKGSIKGPGSLIPAMLILLSGITTSAK